MFQENKARQIFQQTNISYPLIRTLMCAYQGEGLEMFLFSKICRAFFFFTFEIRLFALLTTKSLPGDNSVSGKV